MNGLPTSLRIAGVPPASMGGLTYDPSPVPGGVMASNVLANILGLIEAERQRRAEQGLLQQIFQEAGVIPKVEQQPTQERPRWKKAFDIFNPTLPPLTPPPLESKLAATIAPTLLRNKLETQKREKIANSLGLNDRDKRIFLATGRLPEPVKGTIRVLGNKIYKINPVTGEAEVIAEETEKPKPESIEQRLEKSALEKLMQPEVQTKNLSLDVGGITPQFQNVPITTKRPPLNEAERAILRAKGFIKEQKQPTLTPYQSKQLELNKQAAIAMIKSKTIPTDFGPLEVGNKNQMVSYVIKAFKVDINDPDIKKALDETFSRPKPKPKAHADSKQSFLSRWRKRRMDYSTITSKQLWEDALKGDRRAYEELVKRGLIK